MLKTTSTKRGGGPGATAVLPAISNARSGEGGGEAHEEEEEGAEDAGKSADDSSLSTKYHIPKILFDSVNMLIISIDRKGKVKQWNRESAGVTGFAADEAVGHLLSEFVSLEYRRVVPQLVNEVFSTQQPRNNVEITLRCKTGGAADVVVNIVVWRDPQRVEGQGGSGSDTGDSEGEGGGNGGSGTALSSPRKTDSEMGGVDAVLIIGHVVSAKFGQRYRLLAENANQIFKWAKGKVGEKGAFGRVVLARRLEGNQVVAIKKIDLTGRTLDGRRKVREEARILSNIAHPNVVDCFEYFIEGNELHIVMEYADAGNLRQLVETTKAKKGVLDEELVFKIFTQMVLAVEFLHSKRIMHRDLKCLNSEYTAYTLRNYAALLKRRPSSSPTHHAQSSSSPTHHAQSSSSLTHHALYPLSLTRQFFSPRVTKSSLRTLGTRSWSRTRTAAS
jgi:PAS domain S-box-containing protein